MVTRIEKAINIILVYTEIQYISIVVAIIITIIVMIIEIGQSSLCRICRSFFLWFS